MDDAILEARPVQGTLLDAHRAPPQEPPGSPPPEKVRAFNLHRLLYSGQAGEVFRLALVNSLLSLLTLGLYRFWARTRLRRYFWSHVELDGDPIEYTGTGRQLFIGFLIVMAVLVPLLFGLDYAASRFPQGAWQQGVIGLVQGLGFLFLFQSAVFRARRYRLGHTRWRGIRASQTGSSLRYALRAAGYLMLTFLTLGLAYPLYRVKTQRYLMENTCIGNQAFAFEGRARALFWKWLTVWVLSLLALFALSFWADIFIGFTVGAGGFPVFPAFSVEGAGRGYFIGLVAVTMTVLLLMVWYRTAEFRYFAKVTSFGSLRFASELTARNLFGIYALYYLIVGVVAASVLALFMSSLVGLELGLVSALEGTAEEKVQQIRAIVLVLGLVALLFAAAVVSVLQPVLIGHPLLKKAIASIRFRGRYDVEGLVQSAQAAERRGEGLADAFDVEMAGF